MGNILEFRTPLPARTDPGRDLLLPNPTVLLSAAVGAKSTASNIARLNKTLRNIELVILHIDDTETRERLQDELVLIHQQLLLASKKLLNAVNHCQVKATEQKGLAYCDLVDDCRP